MRSSQIAKTLGSNTSTIQLPDTLQWRHNEHDGISNHQPRDCLLNCLFMRRSKKISKLCVTGLCEGNSPKSPHKGPVTRKMFPFDEVIMTLVLHQCLLDIYFVPLFSRDAYWFTVRSRVCYHTLLVRGIEMMCLKQYFYRSWHPKIRLY